MSNEQILTDELNQYSLARLHKDTDEMDNVRALIAKHLDKAFYAEADEVQHGRRVTAKAQLEAQVRAAQNQIAQLETRIAEKAIIER